MKIRPSVALVDENTVLLMKYRYGETDVWGIPGGGVHDGETLIDALKRELDEELGVAIEVGELLCLVEVPAAGKVKHTLHCVFLGRIVAGAPRVNPEHTTALSVEWIDAGMPDDIVLYPPVNDVLRQALGGHVEARYLGVREREWF